MDEFHTTFESLYGSASQSRLLSLTFPWDSPPPASSSSAAADSPRSALSSSSESGQSKPNPSYLEIDVVLEVPASLRASSAALSSSSASASSSSPFPTISPRMVVKKLISPQN